MTLRKAEYRDAEGRLWLRSIPENSPDSEAVRGIPVGPPSLDELGLPLPVEVALHNQLYARGIFTERDAHQRLGEIQSALKAALRVDAQRILAIYAGKGVINAHDST